MSSANARSQPAIWTKDQLFSGFSKEKEGKWKGPFCFIQGADTQFGMIDTFVFRKPKTTSWEEELKLTRQAIASINRMRPRPRFFVVCGDLVDALPGDKNKEAQEADFKKVFTELDPEIPLVCVCGNHDIGNTPTGDTVNSYRDKFGSDYFAFWVGGVKFIVLNSQYYEDCSQVPEIREAQDKWLDQELADIRASDCKHAIVFQHIPWFLKKPDEEKEYFNIDMPLRKQMLDKFNNAGVVAIFCGHYHRNAGGFYGSMEIVVTSAIGCQLGEEKSGFRIARVIENKVQHKYYGMDDVPTNPWDKESLSHL